VLRRNVANAYRASSPAVYAALLKEASSMSVPTDGKAAANAPRYSRRLSDKILIAFHQACDQNDAEDAELLWAVLETVLSQRRCPAGAAERRAKENLDGAYERLRQVRHSDPDVEFDALLE
jgi:hypothetical protein